MTHAFDLPEGYVPTPTGRSRRGEHLLIVSGYGVRLAVERGHLVVDDGVGRTRRRARYARPTSRLGRVVVLAPSGEVTLDALRWIQDVGAAFTHVYPDGRVIVASGPQAHDTRLRRAQGVASTNGRGLAVARDLVLQKLRAQGAALGHLPSGARLEPMLAAAERAVVKAPDVDALRSAEGEAAKSYWAAWRDVPIRFRPRDRKMVPDHWRTFGTRISPLTRSPRRAINPANAILNYLYAMLESEARIACLAMGLDPALGFLHADYWRRDALGLDVMEPVRPIADAYALKLLEGRELSRNDLVELPRGECRLLPRLTHELALTGRIWAQHLGPVVERVAHLLTAPGTRRGERGLPARLTRRKNSAAQARRRVPSRTLAHS